MTPFSALSGLCDDLSCPGCQCSLKTLVCSKTFELILRVLSEKAYLFFTSEALLCFPSLFNVEKKNRETSNGISIIPSDLEGTFSKNEALLKSLLKRIIY